jgi:hypothetical protein
MRKIIYLLIIVTIFLGVDAKSQNALKSFQWRDHLPYNQAFSVTHQGNKIFAVSNECIFSYNKDDQSYQRLNKVTGLSDIEPIIVKNNPYNNALLVLYKNSNIDVLKDGGVTNVSDLLRKQNIGNKTINSVTFSKNLAYLACGFGIVVFDTDALQFQDTYIIGPGATNLNVYQVAVSNNYIFAATSKGIYQASLTSSNLASYTNWQQVTSLPQPNGIYNGIVNFGGNILASYSWNLSNNQSAASSPKDTLYKFDGTSWSKNSFNTVDGINKLIVSDDGKQFIVLENIGFVAYDLAANQTNMQWQFTSLPAFNNSTYYNTDVIPDPTEAGWYWETNAVFGLLKFKNTTDVPQKYYINGPTAAGCNQIKIKDDIVIASPNFLGYKQSSSYNMNGVYCFKNDAWTVDVHSSYVNNVVFDIDCIAFDYNDKNHFYAGSFDNGVIELKNDSQVAKYNCHNSPLSHRNFIVTYPDNTTGPDTGETQVTSLCSDINNNLWITTNDNPKFITIKKNDNSWKTLDFSNLVPNVQYLSTNQIVVDSNSQAYVASYGTGVFVYKNDGTFSQPNASNSKLLTNLAGKGGLPSNFPICLAVDKSGDVWIGTDQGIYVLYSPESILTQSSGWDAQPIYVQQDGLTQLLLQTDLVNSIFVDGANNKWVGTASSGLFCFSSDGQKELYHFTTDNSLLFSNNVLTVSVSGKTGEVFIGTDRGIQSFQNTTNEGLTNFEDVYAYPNPVKPGYTGPILIHGMISGASVKIVDGGGNFVYETTAEGGQAIWNGQNFKGARVASGVYMVICATPDGSQKKLTKILLLN